MSRENSGKNSQNFSMNPNYDILDNKMKKIYIGFLCMLFVLGVFGFANALTVELSGDSLTLDAHQASVHEILEKIADYGVDVYIDPAIDFPVSASFENRKIRKGLASILKPYSFALTWKSAPGALEGMTVLSAVRVFEKGKPSAKKPIVSSNRLKILKNPADGSLFVKDELLLKLKPGVSIKILKKLLAKIGGSVIDGNRTSGIVKVRLPENTDVYSLAEAINETGIAGAEPNFAYPGVFPRKIANTSNENDPSRTPSLSRGEVPIAVLDSGLHDYPGLEKYVSASLDAFNPDHPITDSTGHGTQMAMIASGMVNPVGAPVNNTSRHPVVAVKSLDENGYTSNFKIMSSIDFAMEKGARIMSLSWGSDTESAFLEEALQAAESKGMIILGASGNEPTGKPHYPAAYSSVIGVGALSPDGQPWEKSNYGDFVKVYAPGYADLPVGHEGDPGTYAGTSIATAYTANVMAGFLEKNPGADKKQILEHLKKQAK